EMPRSSQCDNLECLEEGCRVSPPQLEGDRTSWLRDSRMEVEEMQFSEAEPSCPLQ
ncbi:hypothetical protein AVEN_269176-1, partial [Araneus ventricosus]